MSKLLTILFSLAAYISAAQPVSNVWVGDNGNGSYKNPILHADYSDPDAIRVGDDYYMISSSFNHIPGLPILQSKDLVNWKLVGHALQKQIPFDHFKKVQHGNGVWAPSIRFHNGQFYIYYPDPDFGIYLIKSANILGPWSEPVLVEEGKGLIDPCPLWDDNGKVYLVHAFAGSRAGIKSIIVVKELNREGSKVISTPRMIYDGHADDPTIEGPKFHKRNGYYYIFAPAGGVSTGWQLVLRSRNIYGPYERKIVMDQGSSPINGPHQGAWVNTKTNEDWFLHFQDKEAYGRVVHLQPMKWVDNWPVIGLDSNGDGKGEPVLSYNKPNVGRAYPIQTPPESDEFIGNSLGLQWQWQANPGSYWAFPYNGHLRMFSYQLPDSIKSYWDAPNLLMQKFPAEEFMATAKITFKPKIENERFGLIVHGVDYGYIGLVNKPEGKLLSFGVCKEADKGKPEKNMEAQVIISDTVYFRVTITKGAVCEFSYSEDGMSFKTVGEKLTAKPGRWVGAKVGLFSARMTRSNDSGYADIDWFRVEKVASGE